MNNGQIEKRFIGSVECSDSLIVDRTAFADVSSDQFGTSFMAYMRQVFDNIRQRMTGYGTGNPASNITMQILPGAAGTFIIKVNWLKDMYEDMSEPEIPDLQAAYSRRKAAGVK